MQSGMNPLMPVNQGGEHGVPLTTSGGRVVSDVDASNASYSGMDVSRMSLTLVNEKADEVVAQLYGDYCRNAAPAPAPRAAPKKQ
jgi:hypothetical protein